MPVRGSFRGGGEVNSGHRFVYKVMSELICFQQTPYNLQPVTQIADLLCNFDDLDEELEGDMNTLAP